MTAEPFERIAATIDYPTWIVTAANERERAGGLDGCDWFAGRVLSRVDSGDHVGHLLDPFDGVFRDRGGARLGFQDVRDVDPGHAVG